MEKKVKHSMDLRMSANKAKLNALQKIRKSKALGNHEDQTQSTTFQQRVFLYFQPKFITYPLDDIPYGRAEIEVEHRHNTITTLSDYFMPQNIIDIDQFHQVKPTFSITIDQDSLEDLTVLCDTPVLLTVYVHMQRISHLSTVSEMEEQSEEDAEERLPVAQGYIDILEYFNKKRSRSTETIYLYPLKSFGQILTCKTEWEIYSLHPLIKNLNISNILFITLGSFYNIKEEFMTDYESLAANFSLISKTYKEENEMNKIFICKFTKFHKDIIVNQNLAVTWESLKTNNEYENSFSMGIASETKFTLSGLFTDVFCTENVEFKFNEINIREDFALICNSMHRYALTDDMQKTLEENLATNQYEIVIEIYSEQDEKKILLQGYMDLSIFMYPEVNYCTYAVELKPPDSKSNPKVPVNESVKSGKAKGRSKNIINSEVVPKEEKASFAIVNICLNSPVTNPPKDISNLKSTRNKYNQCKGALKTEVHQINSTAKCDVHYKRFDELVLEILDYMIRNKIKSINDDKEFFCNQMSNITNRIMKLIACDFNRRMPTKTNIEFTNLLTTVYRDLLLRIYSIINKCSVNSIDNCTITMAAAQNSIIKNFSIAKCMYEIGNSEIADYFINKLRSQHLDNKMLNFFLFLYNIEKGHLDSAQEYLDLPLDDKDLDGQMFTDIIQIYVNYKVQLQDPIESQTAEELLINALTDYSQAHRDDSLTGWILLYCLYKKYNYQPGMSYCRWKYENLYDERFVTVDFIPKTCWDLYLPHKMKFKSVKAQNFAKVFEKLLNLGLYDFAEWVFTEIANECLEVESYFILNTFKILKQSDKANISIKTFALNKLENAKLLRATLSQVNGNLEYYRDCISSKSYKHYQEIVGLDDFNNFNLYELALLRYAYRKMEDRQYEEAAKAFDCCCVEETNGIAGIIGKGKACYYLGLLDEAEKYFALSTKFDIYMPNTWAYLALINLRRGNNYNALECWKYARLDQDEEIHSEILNELNKIDYKDVFMYVDIPSKI